MSFTGLAALVMLVLFMAAIVKVRRRRSGKPRRYVRPGSAAVGSIYDMLNEDKRRAIEIIVEERAGERDPETADGNLPDLEQPDRGGRL